MKKTLVVSVLSCAMILTGAFYAFGQKNASEIQDKRITLKLERGSLREIFNYLIRNYDIEIGLEQSVLDRDHNDYAFGSNLPYFDPDPKIRLHMGAFNPIKRHWFTVNFENERLKDVLDVLVGQMENYKWEISDGVVNIFPVKGRDKKYEQLLKINIKEFTLEKNSPIFLIKSRLFALPEIVKFLAESELSAPSNRVDIDFMTRPLPEEMQFSDLTFKELLNKITKIKGGGWLLKQRYTESSNENKNTNKKEYIDLEI